MALSGLVSSGLVWDGPSEQVSQHQSRLSGHDPAGCHTGRVHTPGTGTVKEVLYVVPGFSSEVRQDHKESKPDRVRARSGVRHGGGQRTL